MNKRLSLLGTSALSLALLLGACGRQETEAPPAEQAAPEPAATVAPAAPTRTQSAENTRVFFITPANGDTVSSPVRIEFGLEGMNVVAAGGDTPNSGHHHLLVDTELPDMELPIPADANHIHFGDASTSTELALEPGEHTLQLLLGDSLHIPHDPPVVSARIRITVE